ncbi:MAG: RNA polymerase sigma factor [Bacteroidetes bacterium]|nr:RNA polymerase sigma factor [Bacteroidota bacterium]
MKAYHGKEESAESLYVRYSPALLSVCLRYCGNLADAEDVLHDGFIKIIRNLPKFRPGPQGSLEAWMRRIMVNTSLNHIRDHAKERKFLDIDPISERINNDEPEETSFDELAGKVNPDKVMELICELPTGYRTVFNMYVFESYSHREIAHFLNCSENTSKSQLSKARGILRKELDHFYCKQVESDEKATRQS